MTQEAKMKKAIRKVFEAMQGQTGEMKSDFEKYRLLVHAVISNLGEFRGEDAENKSHQSEAHWVEDVNRLKSVFETWDSIDDQSSYMISEYRSTVLEIINKYAK